MVRISEVVSKKESYIEQCVKLRPSHMIELVGLYPIPLNDIRDMTARFVFAVKQSEIEDEVPSNASRHFGGIFFVEMENESTRSLGVVTAPEFELNELIARSEMIWDAICPGGSVVCKPIVFPSGHILYCTKEIRDDSYDPLRVIFLP
jgi:hypothetical protein